ncbi:PadR family transcriptional regulator [Candidatus Saccharibacteria bacterium]|nr:PadR family transcriptional regulator [Candidatus Saccharibacteria bacterium]
MSAVNQELVDEQAYSWTEMHKKSALSYLILAALQKQPMWSKELEKHIVTVTGWSISERALYRVLSRMHKQGSIEFTAESAERTGADRKVYAISPEGKALLAAMQDELLYLAKV